MEKHKGNPTQKRRHDPIPQMEKIREAENTWEP